MSIAVAPKLGCDIFSVYTEVTKVKIPWAYAEELYQLRLHIRYVREGLDRGQPGSGNAQAMNNGALEDAS